MKPINILLVEDDMVDAMDIKRSLDKLNIFYTLNTAKNGEEAMEFLHDRGEFGLKELPDIILIDINMPKMNGLEFLGKIRDSSHLKDLKCFIITTSDAKVDKQKAEKLGVSGYIVKPLKLAPSSMDAFNLMIDIMNFKSAS